MFTYGSWRGSVRLLVVYFQFHLSCRRLQQFWCPCLAARAMILSLAIGAGDVDGVFAGVIKK